MPSPQTHVLGRPQIGVRRFQTGSVPFLPPKPPRTREVFINSALTKIVKESIVSKRVGLGELIFYQNSAVTISIRQNGLNEVFNTFSLFLMFAII